MEIPIEQLRALIEQAQVEQEKCRKMVEELLVRHRRYRELLEIVHDAGPRHSANCDCTQCDVWRLVDGELRKET